MPTEVQEACFEAGIKFGSLYHQFAGTPVSPESADSLARAIEESIENQPHCAEVSVEPRMEALKAAIEAGDAEYTEFTGRFAEVSLTVEYEGVTVDAHMEMDGEYPLMRLVSVERRD
ncbi:dihydroneopterin aldolase family protein [Natronorarus salvus]|uniref:dihydroneopterin aldolase family protein n=1 Tax=Natronorarus salvus TaxID=3117733 RepID=UPI002F268220